MTDGRLKLLLGVSLALNLFLLGIGIGVGVMGARMLRDRMETRAPAVWQAARALPQEDRRLLRQMLRDRAIKAAPHVRAAREARREAAELIAAPHYDAAAVTAALSRARTNEMQARSEIDDAILSVLPNLDPQRRAALAGALVNGRFGRGGGGRGFGPRGGPRDEPPDSLRDGRPAPPPPGDSPP